MSEAVSALSGASFDGIARVREAGLRGMITLRGDLSAPALKAAATGVTGVDFPGQGVANCSREHGLCWMSPDELLVLVPYGEVRQALDTIETALAGSHVLAANVSDARAVFSVEGPQAREVLAKLTPADLSPAALQPGQFRRTRLAQAPAAFWMRADESFEVICFRSVAGYVFKLLSASAAPGAEVGYF
jgi:sarcosine oxidase subunit gamma